MAYDLSSLFGTGTDLASGFGIGTGGEGSMPSQLSMMQGLSEGGGGGSYSPDVGWLTLPSQQFSLLTTPGYNPYMANNPRANANGLVPLSSVGGDPNARSIYLDLKNAGLSDAQIQQYGKAATDAMGPMTGNARDPAAAAQGKDWAANYMSVLNQVAKDNPALAQRLSQNITPALQQSSRAYAGSMGAQAAEAAKGSRFDSFMGQWGWTLPLAGAAAAAAGSALAAGGAASAGAGAGAGATDLAATDLAGVGAGGMAEGGLTGGAAAAGGAGVSTIPLSQVGDASPLGGGFLNTAADTGTAAGGSGVNIASSFPSDFVSASSAGGVPTAADLGTAGAITSAAPYSLATAGTGVGVGGGILGVLDNLYNNPTVKNIGNAITGGGVGAGTGSGSTTNGSYQFPYGQVLGALIGAYGANQSANQYKDMINTTINADQWRSQQPKYFDPLYQATTQGIGNTAYGQSLLDSVMRSDASKGYNMSGNFVADSLKGLNSGTTDYIKAVTPLAMGNSPYGAQTSAMQLGSQSIAQNQNSLANLGYAAGSVMQGQQPTGLQQLYAMSQGKPTQNNSLAQAIGLS